MTTIPCPVCRAPRPLHGTIRSPYFGPCPNCDDYRHRTSREMQRRRMVGEYMGESRQDAEDRCMVALAHGPGLASRP